MISSPFSLLPILLMSISPLYISNVEFLCSLSVPCVICDKSPHPFVSNDLPYASCHCFCTSNRWTSFPLLLLQFLVTAKPLLHFLCRWVDFVCHIFLSNLYPLVKPVCHINSHMTLLCRSPRLVVSLYSQASSRIHHYTNAPLQAFSQPG